MIQRTHQEAVIDLDSGALASIHRVKVPRVTLDGVGAKNSRLAIVIDALGNSPALLGPALTFSVVVAEQKPAAANRLVSHRQTHERVTCAPLPVQGQNNVAQHIGRIVDFTMGAERSTPIPVDRDRVVFPAPLLPLPPWLVAGVVNMPLDGSVRSHGVSLPGPVCYFQTESLWSVKIRAVIKPAPPCCVPEAP